MGAAEGGGVVNAPRQEQRVFGFLADVDKLAGILAKHPDESADVGDVYRDERDGGWWRVTVQIPLVVAFCPRFEAFDDAVSFRLRAVEMTTRADQC